LVKIEEKSIEEYRDLQSCTIEHLSLNDRFVTACAPCPQLLVILAASIELFAKAVKNASVKFPQSVKLWRAGQK